MWKPEHRAAADRRGLRYPSDLTDAEWALVAPLIRPAKRGGRPRSVNVREVLNAVFYVLWTGCQWKACRRTSRRAARSGSTSTCGTGTARWGAFITRCMSRCARRQAGRPVRRTAIIDSQTVKGALKGGPRSTRPAMTLARRCWAASATS